MKSKEFEKFLYLITNKRFRDLILNPNYERDFLLKQWIDANPEFSTQVDRAREFIEQISFKTAQLLPFEEDGLLEKILSIERPFINPK